MSWGDGKYMDYCLKINLQIKERKLSKKDAIKFIKKKYQYVKQVANVTNGQEQFIQDILHP